jgi:6-phosphogluconolactonase
MKTGLLYVGTHRRAHRADPVDVAFGIYAFRKEPGSGRLIDVAVTETPQPGWIAVHPRGRFLYVTNEVGSFEGADGGGVSAFAIDTETGSLTPLNTRRTPPLPCHCEVDASGRYLLVATFGAGTVHLFPLMSDGRIGPEADAHRHTGSSVHPRRQTQPHAHAVGIDPANCFVLVPDLGTDRIIVYELEHESGKLIPRPERNVRLAPGSGPRHVTFDPRARFVYLLNEMSATITTFGYDMTHGGLREIQTVDALPDGFSGLRSGAEVGIHPAGRFLYATTRSHGSSGEPPARGLDSIVWFEIDQEHGVLRPRGRVPSGGQIPRTFTFDSSGDYLFVGHQCSGTVVTFRIDPHTGTPIATGEVIASPVAVCVRFITTN